jgi:type II secretory pathway pseudopilin PulG
MIVVCIIGLLAAIAIPNFIRARAVSQANACINNLRVIDSAADEFALETGKSNGDPIRYPRDLKPYIRLNAFNRITACPAGGRYSLPTVGSQATCSLGNTVNPPHVSP